MTMQKKKGLSRADAAELYSDLQKALSQVRGQAPSAAKVKKGSDASAAKQIAAEISKAMAKDTGGARRDTSSVSSSMTSYDSYEPGSNRGAMTAVIFVAALGIMRLTLSGLEAMGIAGATPAQALMQTQSTNSQSFSKEEVRVLTSLDSRRSELTQKGKALEDREHELDARDREFAIRTSQLKELTDKLRSEREKNEKKRSAQTEQLANVYSSMSPQESAQLMEQLDVTIALQLIEKMPEKRIGQILALMSKERALMLTKMLSAR